MYNYTYFKSLFFIGVSIVYSMVMGSSYVVVGGKTAKEQDKLFIFVYAEEYIK